MSSTPPQLSGMSEAPFSLPPISTEVNNCGGSVEILDVEDLIDLQPCCMQFSPRSPKYLVVGTYKLEDPNTQDRNGTLLLYVLFQDKLFLLDEYTHSGGILDIQFNSPKVRSVENFAVASSTGSISIFKLEDVLIDNTVWRKIVLVETFEIFPKSILITSLAWHSSRPGLMAVSLSSGEIYALNFSDNYTVLHEHIRILNHSPAEAWTVAFGMDQDDIYAGDPNYNGTQARSRELNRFGIESSMTNSQCVYSGGDDSRLRSNEIFRNAHREIEFIITTGTQGVGGPKSIGGHNAGVIAILPFPFGTMVGHDILLTGSYDDHVRVYAMHDHRPQADTSKPKILAELNLGGGVWGLKFMEDYAKPDKDGKYDYNTRETTPTTYRVLASCMQVGAYILEVTGCLKGDWTIKVVASLKFNNDNCLVYAGDVQPALPRGSDRADVNDAEYICVSANFYGKQLCVWKYTKKSAPLSPKSLYLKQRAETYGQG